MNTETLDLITGIVEELIAAIPQIVVVLTTVVYSLNAIKAKVNTFPKIATETKQEVDNKISASNAKMTNILEETKRNVITTLEETSANIERQIGATLVGMEEELAAYKSKLSQNIEQTNLLAQQNKLFMDIILDLVAKDPKKVSEGVTQSISTKINLTKEQLENYPEVLVKDLDVLKSALKEAKLVLSEKSFEEVLKEVGYGKDH